MALYHAGMHMSKQRGPRPCLFRPLSFEAQHSSIILQLSEDLYEKPLLRPPGNV